MKILLIEDNLTIIKGLKYNLEINDFVVLVASCIKKTKEYLINDGANLYLKVLPSGTKSFFFIAHKAEQNKKIAVMNLLGRTNMGILTENPFLEADNIKRNFQQTYYRELLSFLSKKN